MPFLNPSGNAFRRPLHRRLWVDTLNSDSDRLFVAYRTTARSGVHPGVATYRELQLVFVFLP